MERAGEVEIGLIDIYGLYCENAVVHSVHGQILSVYILGFIYNVKFWRFRGSSGGLEPLLEA